MESLMAPKADCAVLLENDQPLLSKAFFTPDKEIWIESCDLMGLHEQDFDKKKLKLLKFMKTSPIVCLIFFFEE